MKFFTHDQLLTGEDVPSEGSWIGAEVMGCLEALELTVTPKLLHVGVHDGDDDLSLYEVLLELVPGLEIATNYGLPEDLTSDMTEEEMETVEIEAQDSLISWVEEAVQGCMPRHERLGEIVHQARLSTRRILADWSRDGVHARLVDVRLAPYDQWRGATEPALTVMIEALGDRLMPEVTEVQLETPDQVATELSSLREVIAHRCARNSELLAQGATGTISRLALNAIESFGDREATLRRFGAEWRFWLPDDTALLMQNGDVHAGNGRADDAIQWHALGISMDARLVDESRLGSAVGRPVTELVDHKFLSDDLIVTAVSSDPDEGRGWVTLQLDMPRLLFCSITGRCWAQEGGETANGGDAADCGNVVQFRRRAG